MPTFIDESGDTGLVADGGKPFFRLAAVWVPGHDVAQDFRDRVRATRRHLDLKDDFEFKFANSHVHPDRRAAFFSAALEIPFRFAVSVIDKRAPHRERGHGPEQHWACATELAALLRPVDCEAELGIAKGLKEPVIVDGNGDGAFLTVVKTQFRALKSAIHPGKSLVDKVVFRDSSAEEMLQLVDVVCGSVGAAIDGNQRRWYEMIAQRDVEWPIVRK